MNVQLEFNQILQNLYKNSNSPDLEAVRISGEVDILIRQRFEALISGKKGKQVKTASSTTSIAGSFMNQRGKKRFVEDKFDGASNQDPSFRSLFVSPPRLTKSAGGWDKVRRKGSKKVKTDKLKNDACSPCDDMLAGLPPSLVAKFLNSPEKKQDSVLKTPNNEKPMLPKEVELSEKELQLQLEDLYAFDFEW